jgi:hypothetical protein
MPLVFVTPYKKTYSSEFCSLSTLIGFVFLVLAILIPLFAAFSSEDFWLRLKEYLEQPKIDFTNDYILYVSTFDSNNNPTRTFFDSSNKTLNDMINKIGNYNLNSNLNLISREDKASISKYSYDDDNDGINDRLIIRYETNKEEIITNNNNIDVKLIFFVNYRLTKEVKLLMTPMIYVDIPIINGAKEINLSGDLELVQKSPIVSTTVTSQIYNKKKPLTVDEKLNSPLDLLNIYNEYKNMNYTLKYNYEKVEKSAQGKLIINIEMNIPKLQRVFYIQSVFEAIKYAWMQYFYIFLPIYIILYSIYKFIIESNIFYSHVKSDL